MNRQRPRPKASFFIVCGLACGLALQGCDDPREQRCRKAVRALAASNPLTKQQALRDVVRLGRFALVDIEQELHGAGLQARLKLLDAVEKIGLREALPLLRFYQRWDPRKPVRQRAKEIYQLLSAKPGQKAPSTNVR